jgi:hypothetical protein
MEQPGMSFGLFAVFLQFEGRGLATQVWERQRTGTISGADGLPPVPFVLVANLALIVAWPL